MEQPHISKNNSIEFESIELNKDGEEMDKDEGEMENVEEVEKSEGELKNMGDMDQGSLEADLQI